VVVGRISWLGRMLMRVALLLVEVNEDGDGNRMGRADALYARSRLATFPAYLPEQVHPKSTQEAYRASKQPVRA
jgi:hypothetical protein